MESLANVKQGLATADNNRFLRYWWEVDFNNIGFSSKKLLDLKYNNILKRTKNIVSQKDCGAYYRNVKNRHLKTISCSYDLPNSTGFIILDDIVTSGTTMDSCKEILINHGAKEKNIICLAIAKTIDCRHLKYHNGKVVLCEDI